MTAVSSLPLAQQPITDLHIGYIVKRYPRFSETFIVQEILAHERAGVELDIFALRPPNDTHFQDLIAQVRSPVHYLYLSSESWLPSSVASTALKGTAFWNLLQRAAEVLPEFWQRLAQVQVEAEGQEVRNLHQAITLACLVKQKKIHHLHAHFGSLPTTIARLAAYFAGIPYSFTAHAKDIFHESVISEKLAQKLRDASAVVTVSDYNLNYLRQHYGPDAARVQRIYNGLDLSQFPYQSPQIRPPRIIAVGRLVEKKGFADLIAACAHLKQEGLAFDCQIIGGGDLAHNLQAQIEQLDLEQQVHLLGPQPQHRVKALIQGAAVFAAPCVIGPDGNRDGLPTVLLEAMALGTPCVSTAVTGIPEVLRHQETGLEVAQANPSALATALRSLLLDANLRLQLSQAARQLIEQQFDIERNSAHLRRCFQTSLQASIELPQKHHEYCLHLR